MNAHNSTISSLLVLVGLLAGLAAWFASAGVASAGVASAGQRSSLQETVAADGLIAEDRAQIQGLIDQHRQAMETRGPGHGASEPGLPDRLDQARAARSTFVDPIAQRAYLKGSNTEASDLFGRAVAVSGNTVVVGADNEASSATGVNGNEADNSANEAGAAYVFVRSQGSWIQEAYLKASNAEESDCFGISVAISGDTLVVGSFLEDSSAIGVNGDEADNAALNSGAAYVFVRAGGSWTQQAYLKASNTDESDLFGTSVAISGDTLVVGATQERSGSTGVNGDQTDNSMSLAGAAYVFVRSGNQWTQEAYLKASNASTTDLFGVSVGVSDDTVIVGAHFEDSSSRGVNGDESDNSASVSGAAYVFRRTGGSWAQEAYLKASNTDPGDQFGFAVGVSGDSVIVGSHFEGSGSTGVNGDASDNSSGFSGAAYVFVRSGESWNQEAYLKASNTGIGDRFGESVAISRDAVVVGSSLESGSANVVNGDQLDNGALAAGAAYVFVRSSGSWAQQAFLKPLNTEADDRFGRSVAISGDTVVAGARREASGATGVNGDAADNSAPFAGAAHIFAGSGSPGIGTATCAGSPSSVGVGAFLAILGSAVATDNDITLGVIELPQMSVGYFLTSTGAGTIANPGGSAGDLCISSPDIGRYAGSVLSSGSTGSVSQPVDLTSVPSATGSVQVLAGETRYFQFWFRDVDSAGVPTSNFSSARRATFQ